jgi:hypothetical protein
MLKTAMSKFDRRSERMQYEGSLFSLVFAVYTILFESRIKSNKLKGKEKNQEPKEMKDV